MLKDDIKDMLSDRPGSLSSSRVIMFLFAFAAIGILLGIFRHMAKLADPTLLGVWINGLPAIGGVLIGLMAAPYTIKKGAGTLTDIANLMVSARSNQPVVIAAPATPTPASTTVVVNPQGCEPQA